MAERAATSQQWVSRVERGLVNLRLLDAERLFAVTGTRLVVQTVRLDRHQDFRGYDADVERPGERRWRIAGLFEVLIDVVAELPTPLIVAAAKTELPVVPLVTLLRDDPDIAELARRLAG